MLTQLTPHNPCNPNWSAYLEEPLDNLRLRTMITSMILTLERRSHSASTPSLITSPATLCDDNGTPPASMVISDPGSDDGLGSDWPFSPGKMPSHPSAPSLPLNDYEGSREMASQLSDMFGFYPGNFMPEQQNNDTWRQ
jgi:hypothetical protein